MSNQHLSRKCSSLFSNQRQTQNDSFLPGEIFGSELTLHSDLRIGAAQESVIDKCNKKKDCTLRAAEWNVRSLLGIGKFENLKREMDRLSLDVVELSEVRWQQANNLM